MAEKKITELSPEEEARDWRLVRRCDAFDTMRRAVDGDLILEGPDKENALAELRHLQEDADNALKRRRRELGLAEPGE